MALVVEDGTGLSTANCYVTRAEANAYFADRPTQDAVWDAAIGSQKDEALILATMYLDAVYGGSWIGDRAVEGQALDWPRAAAETPDGRVLSSTAVPQEVKDAVFEAAVRAAPVGSDTLLPDLDNPGDIESEFNKVGPIETRIKYSGAGASQQKKYGIIDGILRRLIWASDRAVRG